MARIRTIKPEFFTSEDIVALSPYARLLYIALWCEADREGRLLWKPKTLKMRYFPADELDINNLCAELINCGLVCLYGQDLAYIPKFLNHQNINPRESVSRLPSHDSTLTRESRVSDASTTRDSHVPDACITHSGEGKGKEHIYNASYFEEFWSAYPKKIAKSVAQRAWCSAKVDVEFNAVMDALSRQILSEQWLKEGGKYIPNPATWINQRRWEDELVDVARNELMRGLV